MDFPISRVTIVFRERITVCTVGRGDLTPPWSSQGVLIDNNK